MPNDSKYSNLLNDKLLQIKLSALDNFKAAYPNYSDGIAIPGQHNMDKWVQTLKDIYYKNNQGMSWKAATEESTRGWNEPEIYDFNNWVSFYQSKNHLKYSKAQSWYVPPDEANADDIGPGEMPLPYAGYFIPGAIVSQEKETTNHVSDINDARSSTIDDVSAAEKAKQIAAHKKKLISRLDSVEKLLRSEEGFLLTEKEYDSLMEAVYSLKKKVSSLRKKSSINSFCQDLIIRQANMLVNDGFFKAASLLYVVAEEAAPNTSTTPAPPGSPTTAATGQTDSPQNEVAGVQPPAPIIEGTPTPPNNTTKLPGADTSEPVLPPAANVKPKPEKPTGAAAVAEAIGGGFKADDGATDDANESDDLIIYDENNDDDLDDYLMVTEAQAIGDGAEPTEITSPAVTPASTTPAATPAEAASVNNMAKSPKAEIEVTDSDVFEKEFHNVLSKVKIEDVVKKIEEVSKIFKTREIPRQLSLIDMMLDKLGLVSFFPSLSEATNKALESNNYILTRVEGILTQLSGAVKTKDVDLTHETAPSPEAEGVRKSLEEQEKLDKERKEMRKELADKALKERAKEETPELEVTEEELGAPAVPASPAAIPPTAAPAPETAPAATKPIAPAV